jgi:8-oxo-dGTP pyrophosphatase MutT (NUDIX family)
LEAEPLRRQAAVVIGIFREPPHGVIFIERASHLRDHPGQIGLPGGSVHADDANLEATALRELEEEVGVVPARVTIVERLSTLQQRVNNFDVTPFVAVVESGELHIDATETAGVFLVPLQAIVSEGPREGTIDFEGFPLRSLVLDYDGYRIWGLTARILYEFVERWNATDLAERVSALLR